MTRSRVLIVDANAETRPMPLPRFRLRTMMIAVAGRAIHPLRTAAGR
jgi:hypothetical protein